jgi:methyl-accepting chemotaxis protein
LFRTDAGQSGGAALLAAGETNLVAAPAGADAAKEIKSLIGASVEKVETGSKLVDHAGATMEEVVASIRRVTEIMSGITTASQEQSAGIEQVNQAIAQMDQVTQQNAALVEQAAAAAKSMQDQAASLSGLVDVFKLEEKEAALA